MSTEKAIEGVRLDKWLWAARFFKTRAKAKQAIEGGKVHLGGQKSKASQAIRPGDQLRIRQGYDEKTIKVTGLSEQRRSATEASVLFEETDESIAGRKLATEQRRSASKLIYSEKRPSKKDRRLIHKFKEHIFQDDN